MNNPSSSSAVTRSIRCAGCAQDNPADRKFCGQCGGRLWLPCMECQSTNAVDEKFCGNCGVNLADSIKKQEAAVRAKIEMAIKLEREGRFYDAQSTLQDISASGDERLSSLQQNALDLLGQLDRRRQQRTVDARRLESQARVQYEQKKYTQAFETLKAIPVGLREHDTIQFMVEVEALYKEITGLTKEIKQALKAKAYTGLIPKVERLCELQPDNNEIRKLGEKLLQHRSADRSREATKLVALAEKKLKEHLYAEAASAMARVAPELLQGKTEQLYRQVRELDWCAKCLRKSTLASDALLKVLRRWKKLAPNDPRIAKLEPQLTSRLAAQPADPRYLRPHWTAPPKATEIGYPVKSWSGLAGAGDAEASIHEAIGTHPGQFAVAYGLALQGLGLGVLQTDLNPKRKAWGKLLSRKKVDRIWGLDLGSTSAKAVELVREDEDDFIVAECLRLPYKKPLFGLSNETAAEIIEETVTEFVETADTKKPRVALGFSGRLGLARFFDLPPIKSKKSKLEDAVGLEVRHQIPIPMEETIFDFHAWDPIGDGFVQLRPITAIAARKDDLQQWMEPVTSAGCDVALLQCDGFALFNALYRDFLSRGDEEQAIAVVDVGGEVTNVVVGERNFVWMRSIVHGVKRWDDSLVRELGVTHAQAEALRKDPTLGRWMHQIADALEPDFTELREDIQRSLLGYPRRSESEIGLLLGTGGGCAHLGLLQNLIHGGSVEAS